MFGAFFNVPVATSLAISIHCSVMIVIIHGKKYITSKYKYKYTQDNQSLVKTGSLQMFEGGIYPGENVLWS